MFEKTLMKALRLQLITISPILTNYSQRIILHNYFNIFIFIYKYFLYIVRLTLVLFDHLKRKGA